MTIYFVMFFLIVAVAPLVGKAAKSIESRKNRQAFFITMVIVLVLALRHPSMGVDLGYRRSNGYLASFQVISSFSWSWFYRDGTWLNYEIGYLVFNKLLGLISTDYQCLLIGCAVASLAPIGLVFRKNSQNFVFSTVVYIGLPCFLILFSGLRQAIAIGICCLAMDSIKEKKLLRFVLTVTIACLFHKTAVAFFVAYPLYNLKPIRYGRLISIIAIPFVYIARYPLFVVLSKIFKPDAVPDNNNAIVLLLVFVLVYCFCSLFVRNSDEESAGYLNLFYLACVCQCFGGLYTTAMRVGYYFMPALAIALPNIVENMKNRDNNLICKNIIMVIFIVYGLYALSASSWAMTNPYHFFWS